MTFSWNYLKTLLERLFILSLFLSCFVMENLNLFEFLLGASKQAIRWMLIPCSLPVTPLWWISCRSPSQDVRLRYPIQKISITAKDMRARRPEIPPLVQKCERNGHQHFQDTSPLAVPTSPHHRLNTVTKNERGASYYLVCNWIVVGGRLVISVQQVVFIPVFDSNVL